MTQEVLALKICTVRNEPVVLDSDLASLYDVETRVFNQAIRRNRHRFPADFAFQLTKKAWSSLSSTLEILKGRRDAHRNSPPGVCVHPASCELHRRGARAGGVTRRRGRESFVECCPPRRIDLLAPTPLGLSA